MAAIGGHKHIFMYLLEKYRIEPLDIYARLAGRSGHLNMCKFIYSKLDETEVARFFFSLRETPYKDVNDFVQDEKFWLLHTTGITYY